MRGFNSDDVVNIEIVPPIKTRYYYGKTTARRILSETGLCNGLRGAANPGNHMTAFVGISVQSHDFLNPRLKLRNDLAAINIPVLDVYAGGDRGKVLRQADDRRLAGSKNGKNSYEQIMIGDADRFYTGKEDVMITRICGWLETKIPQGVVRVDSSAEENIKP